MQSEVKMQKLQSEQGGDECVWRGRTRPGGRTGEESVSELSESCTVLVRRGQEVMWSARGLSAEHS